MPLNVLAWPLSMAIWNAATDALGRKNHRLQAKSCQLAERVAELCGAKGMLAPA